MTPEREVSTLINSTAHFLITVMQSGVCHEM